MSSAVAGLIAHSAFWALLACGWWLGELRVKSSAIFLALWLGAFFARPLVPNGAALFPPVVAVLDIALVFMIFKGDLRLN